LALSRKVDCSTTKAFEIVTNHENDSLNRVNLFKVANRFNINDWKDFKKTVYLVLEKSEDANDSCAKVYLSEIIMFHNCSR
jgi:hypothetical protein